MYLFDIHPRLSLIGKAKSLDKINMVTFLQQTSEGGMLTWIPELSDSFWFFTWKSADWM